VGSTSANGHVGAIRSAVYDYLSRNLIPVPVAYRGKKPLGGENWNKVTVDTGYLDREFPETARRNCGLLWGTPGGLVDVDLDTMAAIAAGLILLPPTGWCYGRLSKPRSHWVYRPDRIPGKGQTKFEDLDGKSLVELRGQGTQSVVPPSVHEKGEPIEWDTYTSPADILLDDLHAAVESVAAAALIAQHWPAEGSRDDAALYLTGGLLRLGWEQERVDRFVLATATAAGDDEAGKRTGKAKQTAEKLKAGKIVAGWPKLAKLLGSRGQDVVARARHWLSTNCADSASEWPAPVPLSTDPSVPPFPVEILPDWIAEWATAQAVELQVLVDLPALLALGLVGGGVARKYIAVVREGFPEPVNMFVMAVLPSGERKSQTFRKACAPVQELQRQLREDARPVIAEAESEHRVAESRVKNLEGKLSKADDLAEKDLLREELKKAREELLKLEVPALPLLYTEDDTPAALKSELVKQGGRLMVATTEAKCLENITLYSDRPDFDVYLKGHAGDEINTGRISRGRESITDPALTCILSPQPGVIQGLAENEVLRGRGFLARWAYSIPESRVGFREIAARAVPKTVRARYAAIMTSVWKSTYGAGEFNEEVANVLTLDAEAEAEFRLFEAWVEPRLAPGAELSATAGWGNKLNGLCARLAAVLHVAEAAGCGLSPWPETIGAVTIRKAVKLCRDYLIAHAKAAFDLMGANTTVTGARKVWKWITGLGLTEFSKRDCFNANRSAFETVDELQPCLDLLERHYLIRPKAPGDQKQGRGRPASPVYEVNPFAEDEGDGPDRGDPDPPRVEPDTPRQKSHKSQKSPPGQTDPISADSAISAQGVPASENGHPGGDLSGAIRGLKWASELDRDAPATLDTGYTLILDADGLAGAVAAIGDHGGPVGLDTETTGLDTRKDRIRLIQLAVGDRTFVLDLFALGEPPLADLFDVLAQVEVIGHNLQFDLRMLVRHGFAPGRVYCTMLASLVLHNGQRNASGGWLDHGLTDVVEREIDLPLDKAEQRSDWSGKLTAAQFAYAAADAAVLIPLAEALRAKLAEAKLTDTAALEMRALPGVAWSGPIAVDREGWLALASTAEAERDRLAVAMDAAAPNPATLTADRNWNSGDEIKKAFRAAGVELDSTDDDTLAGVAHPLAELLRDYRVAQKRAGTYGRKWVDEHAPTG
jgi:hypothetical protein